MNNKDDTKNVKPILSQNAFSGVSDDPLVSRRLKVQGAAAMLFYEQPLHIVKGEDCWLFDAKGKKYLDMYNNVLSVGHGHPKVTEAVTQQMSQLSVHSRYLHNNLIEYSERLLEKSPNKNDFNLVMTCTGSESNDLALRIARKHSNTQLVGEKRHYKSGFIVTQAAYHGNTDLVTLVSPSALKQQPIDNCIETICIAAMPPVSSASETHELECVEASLWFLKQVRVALNNLQARGYHCAAIIIDSVFSSDGVFVQPSGFLQEGIKEVQNHGGLLIADEVQPGFGRTGEAFWAYERHNLNPDIITLGKPMANGYPAAGVICRQDLLELFCADVGYFNTFGGSTVAAAAALATLNVIESEQLQANALHQGTYFHQKLFDLMKQQKLIKGFRGVGLFWAIDIADGDSQTGAQIAQQLTNQLCERGFLLGTTGVKGNSLKIRPPLTFREEHCDLFFNALAEVLEANEHLA